MTDKGHSKSGAHTFQYTSSKLHTTHTRERERGTEGNEQGMTDTTELI